jgi:hypothetical protein
MAYYTKERKRSLSADKPSRKKYKLTFLSKASISPEKTRIRFYNAVSLYQAHCAQRNIAKNNNWSIVGEPLLI